jgi:hypothetical protein
MPMTITTARQLGVPASIANLVVPLGATMNMAGTALYQAVAILFLAQMAGIDLALPQIALITGTLVASSIGAPGHAGGQHRDPDERGGGLRHPGRGHGDHPGRRPPARHVAHLGQRHRRSRRARFWPTGPTPSPCRPSPRSRTRISRPAFDAALAEGRAAVASDRRQPRARPSSPTRSRRWNWPTRR